MKLLICLVAFLYIFAEVAQATQVGDPRLQLFFEYLRPYWRQHRSRLRPFVYSNPSPLWRVARSIEDDPKAVNCLYFDSKIYCNRNAEESVECDARKNFANPLLSNFYTFGMSVKKTVENENVKYVLFPKREGNTKTTAAELKEKKPTDKKYQSVSIHSSELEDKDEGFTITDRECWSKMVQLLDTSTFRREIKIEKVNSQNQVYYDTSSIIGNILVL